MFEFILILSSVLIISVTSMLIKMRKKIRWKADFQKNNPATFHFSRDNFNNLESLENELKKCILKFIYFWLF